MRKLIKKILPFALAAAACAGIAGCGAKKEAPAENTTVKLTAWAWGPNVNIPAIKLAGEMYSKTHPEVSLEVLEIAQDDVVQKMNAALGSGSTKGLPNIVLVEDYKAPTFLQAYPDAFVPLEKAVDMSKFVSYKQFLKGSGGEQYGIPFDIGTAVLYYRKDLIEEAGYTEADMQNLTWDDFEKIGNAVKEKTGINMIPLDPADLGLVRMILQSKGVWYVDPDGNSVDLDNENMKEALTISTDLLKSDSTKIISEWSQFIGSVNSGDVATAPQGCWFTGNIIKEASQSGLWRVAPLPHTSDSNGAYGSSGGSSWYVLNGVEGQEKAVDLLAATLGSSTEFYEEYMKETGTTTSFIPVRSQDIYKQGSDFFGGQAIYKDFIDWADKIPVVNYGADTYQIEDILKVAVQDIMGGMSVDDALKKAQQQADAQIQ